MSNNPNDIPDEETEGHVVAPGDGGATADQTPPPAADDGDDDGDDTEGHRRYLHNVGVDFD